MRSVVTFCLFALMAVAYARPNGTYTDRYDHIDLDGILTNRRLLAGYIKCTLDLGKCTSEGRELRSHLKEGIEENCAKCTPAQRSGTRRVLAHLINHEPEYWNQLKAKYDSTGKYSAQYERELRQH